MSKIIFSLINMKRIFIDITTCIKHVFILSSFEFSANFYFYVCVYFLFEMFCYDGHHLSYCFGNKHRNDKGSQKLLSLPNLLVSVMKMTNSICYRKYS